MLYLSVPVTYRASGSAVLLKPQVTSSPPTTTPGASPGQTAPTTSAAPDNPYVGLNDMSVVLDIVTRRMKTPTVVTRLAEQGVGSFTLGANLDFYRGPILDYSADGARREDAVRGAAVVREEIRRQLDELQAQQGVTAGDFIRLDDGYADGHHHDHHQQGPRDRSSHRRLGAGRAQRRIARRRSKEAA